MVKYKLGVYNRKEGRIIDLEKIIKLKDLNALDELTGSFKNEEELKIYLFNQGLISKEEINKDIRIMYRNNGKIKKLPVVFNPMKKYLDILNLKYELKGLSTNVDFLEKLADHYSLGNGVFNLQGLNVQDIRLYVSDARSKRLESSYSKSLEVAIDDLFIKAVFKVPNKETGEVKENYRGLRDLALFIYKYKNQLAKKEQAKIKENWEQASLFDVINEQKESTGKWILSSEGEPEFPPNSEEEAMYNKYLEELTEKANNQPIDEHPHYRR